MGSAAPSLKKLMKTPAAPIIVTYQSSKRKVVQGATQKAVTRKRLRRTRPSTAQVNNPSSYQTNIQLLIPFSSHLSTIVSQSALGAELLSQALDSAPIEPSSADPQKEPISVEITDASKMVGDVSLSISLPDVAKVFPLNS